MTSWARLELALDWLVRAWLHGMGGMGGSSARCCVHKLQLLVQWCNLLVV